MSGTMDRLNRLINGMTEGKPLHEIEAPREQTAMDRLNQAIRREHDLAQMPWNGSAPTAPAAPKPEPVRPKAPAPALLPHRQMVEQALAGTGQQKPGSVAAGLGQILEGSTGRDKWERELNKGSLAMQAAYRKTSTLLPGAETAQKNLQAAQEARQQLDTLFAGLGALEQQAMETGDQTDILAYQMAAAEYNKQAEAYNKLTAGAGKDLKTLEDFRAAQQELDESYKTYEDLRAQYLDQHPDQKYYGKTPEELEAAKEEIRARKQEIINADDQWEGQAQGVRNPTGKLWGKYADEMDRLNRELQYVEGLQRQLTLEEDNGLWEKGPVGFAGGLLDAGSAGIHSWIAGMEELWDRGGRMVDRGVGQLMENFGKTFNVPSLAEKGREWIDGSHEADPDIGNLRGYAQDKMFEALAGSGKVDGWIIEQMQSVAGMAMDIMAMGMGSAMQLPAGTLTAREIMGIRAAGSAMADARDKGMSEEQQMIYGAISGGLEYASEGLFGGNRMYDTGKGVVNKILDKIVKNEKLLGFFYSDVFDIASEGLEEVFTGFLDPIVEGLVTDKEIDWASPADLGDAFLGGAFLSLTGMAGQKVGEGVEAVRWAGLESKAGKVIRNSDAVRELVAEGLEADKNSEAYKLAVKLQEKLDSGKELTNLEIGRQLAKNQMAIDAGQLVGEELPEEKTPTPMVDPHEGFYAVQVVAPGDYALTWIRPDGSSKILARDLHSVAEAKLKAETMGFKIRRIGSEENLSKAAVTSTEKTDSATDSSTESTNESVNEQLTRNPRESITSENPDQSAQEAPPPLTDEDAPPENMEGPSYEENRQQEQQPRPDRDGGREAPGRQPGSDQKSARRARAEAAVRRTEEAGRVRSAVQALGTEYVSLRQAGLQSGTEEDMVQIVPEEAYTDDISDARDAAESEGLEFQAVVGNMYALDKKGRRHKIVAVIEGDKVFAQADSSSADIVSAVAHEIYHKKAREDPGLNDRLIRYIKDKYTPEETEEIFGKYYDDYVKVFGGTMTEEQMTEAIWEEMLADAYGELQRYSDTFGATKWSEDVQQLVWAGSEAEGQQKTGPPKTMERELADAANIEIAEQPGVSTDVSYNPKTEHITINPNAENITTAAAAAIVTEEAKKNDPELLADIVEAMEEDPDTPTVAEIAEEHKGAGVDLTEEQAQQVAATQYIYETVRNEEKLEALAKKKPETLKKLAQKIKDAFDRIRERMVNALKSFGDTFVEKADQVAAKLPQWKDSKLTDLMSGAFDRIADPILQKFAAGEAERYKSLMTEAKEASQKAQAAWQEVAKMYQSAADEYQEASNVAKHSVRETEEAIRAGKKLEKLYEEDIRWMQKDGELNSWAIEKSYELYLSTDKTINGYERIAYEEYGAAGRKFLSQLQQLLNTIPTSGQARSYVNAKLTEKMEYALDLALKSDKRKPELIADIAKIYGVSTERLLARMGPDYKRIEQTLEQETKSALKKFETAGHRALAQNQEKGRQMLDKYKQGSDRNNAEFSASLNRIMSEENDGTWPKNKVQKARGDQDRNMDRLMNLTEEDLDKTETQGNAKLALDPGENLKKAQNEIIQRENRVQDDEHTWIRSADDILTFDEALDGWDEGPTPDFTMDMINKARETGEIEVFSSYPIKQGTFVTPSRMEAESYAGSKKIYSKTVPLEDVAWIDEIQGQYARVKPEYQARFSLDSPVEDNQGRELSPEQQEFFKDSKIRDDDGRLMEVFHGTNSRDFTVFDWDKTQRTDAGFFGRGFYFTIGAEEATMYGRNVLRAYLNIKNPFIFDEELLNYDDIETNGPDTTGVAFMVNMAEKFPEFAKGKTMEIVREFNDEGEGEVEELPWTQVRSEVESVLKSPKFKLKKVSSEYEGDEYYWSLQTGPDAYDYVMQDWPFSSKEEAEKGNNKLAAAIEILFDKVYANGDIEAPHTYIEDIASDFSEELKRRGYDGVMQTRHGDEIVAFYPEQIKRINNRHPTSDPDIRFALDPEERENRAREKAEKEIAKGLADLMYLNRADQREIRMGSIHDIMQAYQETGEFDQQAIDDLLNEAFAQGVIINSEMYDTYKPFKDYLRTTTLLLEKRFQDDIPDFVQWRKKAMGTLRISSTDGLNVGAAYGELLDQYPGLFVDEMGNREIYSQPSDQLQQLYRIAKGIKVVEQRLDKAVGPRADQFFEVTKNRMQAVVDRALEKYADSVTWEPKQPQRPAMSDEERAARIAAMDEGYDPQVRPVQQGMEGNEPDMPEKAMSDEERTERIAAMDAGYDPKARTEQQRMEGYEPKTETPDVDWAGRFDESLTEDYAGRKFIPNYGQTDFDLEGRPAREPLTEEEADYVDNLARNPTAGVTSEDKRLLLAQARRDGYPILNGVQVIPYHTYVRDRKRGNYGQVIGRNHDRSLVVRFWNKKRNTAKIVDMWPGDITAIKPEFREAMDANDENSRLAADPGEVYREIGGEIGKPAYQNDSLTDLIQQTPGGLDAFLRRLDAPLRKDVRNLIERTKHVIAAKLQLPAKFPENVLDEIAETLVREHLENGVLSDATEDRTFGRIWDELTDKGWAAEERHVARTYYTTALEAATPRMVSVRKRVKKDVGLDMREQLLEVGEERQPDGSMQRWIRDVMGKKVTPEEFAEEMAKSKSKELHGEPKRYMDHLEDLASGHLHRDPTMSDEEYAALDEAWRNRNRRKTEEAPDSSLIIPKTSFHATPALDKLGIKIDGSVTRYRETEQLKQYEKAARQARKILEKRIKMLQATQQELVMARGVADGTVTAKMLDASNVDLNVVLELADYMAAANSFKEDMIRRRKEEINAANAELATQLFGDLDNASPKLKKLPGMTKLVMNERVPERVFWQIFGQDKGEKLYQAYGRPIWVNGAEMHRWENKMLDRVRTFTDAKGKKRGLTDAESAMAQRLMEGQGAVDGLKLLDKDSRERIIAAAENIRNGEDYMDQLREFHIADEYDQGLIQAYVDYLDANAEAEGMDRTIINAAIAEYRKIYDELYDAMNDFLVSHGYQPIGFIRGYSPHFQKQEVQDSLFGALRALGVEKDTAMALPASIAGRTADFKPNMRWNPHTKERKGHKTDYDIQRGYEQYLHYAAEMFYHTDDVMRLRQAVNFFRQKFAGENVSMAIENAQADHLKSVEWKQEFLEKQGILTPGQNYEPKVIQDSYDQYVSNLFEQAKPESLGRWSEFTTWLDNWANIVAGKQSLADRGLEYGGGRNLLNIGSKMMRKFSAANVAGNLSSVLNQTAQLPLIQQQLGTYLERAMGDMMRGGMKKDDFLMRSDFLADKRGVEQLTATNGEKFITALFKPAEMMDRLVSTLAVRGRYLQALSEGMDADQALREADDFGRRVMGSRMKGAKPLAFESKNFVSQMLHVFQVEASNTFDYMLMSEMPKEVQKIYKQKGKAAAARHVAALSVGYMMNAFLLNQLTGALYGGSPAPFDFIGWVLQFVAGLWNRDDEDYLMAIANKGWERLTGEKLFDDVKDLEKPVDGLNWAGAADDLKYNALNDIPYVRNVSGVLGLGDQSLPTVGINEIVKDLANMGKTLTGQIFKGEEGTGISWAGALKESGEDLVNAAAQITPGGRQLKKTLQGISTMIRGGKYAGYGKDARLMYPVERDLWNGLRSVLFGNSALEESDAFYAGDGTALTKGQTQRVKALEEAGVDRFQMYDLYDQFARINKTMEGAEEKNAKREAIDAMELTDMQKLNVYMQTIVGERGNAEKVRDKYETLLDQGITWEQLTDLDGELATLDADEDLDSLERRIAKRDILTAMDLTDTQKLEAFDQYFLDQKAENHDEKLAEIQAELDVGLSWEQITEAHNVHDEIDAGDEKKGDKATEFAYWLDQQGWTKAQKEAVRNRHKYWQMMPAKATSYDKFAEVVSPDTSKEVLQILDGLKPEPGKQDVTVNQKVMAIDGSRLTRAEKNSVIAAMAPGKLDKLIESGVSAGNAERITAAWSVAEAKNGESRLNEMEKAAIAIENARDNDEALSAFASMIDSDSETYARVSTAGEYGVELQDWLDYKRLWDDYWPDYYDEESKEWKPYTVSHDRIGWVLDDMDISNEERAALWQIANKSWKPSKNPYSTSVGWEIYDLLHQE